MAILAPQAFFESPKGVCVDLARFGVESLRTIDPRREALYLMIEFAPVTIEGRLLRRHWMAAFKRMGRYYFFADSKRPGHLAGPYGSVEAFTKDYARYRERDIVDFKLLESFRRQERRRQGKRGRDP